MLLANDLLDRPDSVSSDKLARGLAVFASESRFNVGGDSLAELVRADSLRSRPPETGPLSTESAWTALQHKAFGGRSFRDYLVDVLGALIIHCPPRPGRLRCPLASARRGRIAERGCKEMVTLRQALALAHKRRRLAHNPAAIVPSLSAKYVPRRRYLVHDELTALLDGLAPERRLWMLLAVYTGGRLSEVERLTWDPGRSLREVDPAPGTKTEKSKRRVPIPEPLVEMLEAVKVKQGAVVVPWQTCAAT